MQSAARGVISSSRASTSAASPSMHCKKVFVEISNALHRSNIRWRGRSFAASVPSDSSKPSKRQKRVSNNERRAMVESFVNKYRASNAGKFPTASHAQQQIGGSYYVIREILQEMVYQSKFSPVIKTKDVHLEKEDKFAAPFSDAKQEPSLTEVEEVLSSATSTSCTSYKQSSDFKVDTICPVGTSSDHIKSQITVDISKSFPGEPGICREDASASNHLQGADAPQEVEQKGKQEVPRSEDFHGDIRKLDHEEPSPKSSTLWGNLKSLADGIVSFWKKM